jgi:iron(III) transport system substrate-binding protein
MLAFAGCLSSSNGPDVVVYTALDAEFSEPVFADFSHETRIRVLPKFDTESTKTVGLAHAIMAEARRPRCDVFWNNEILNTLRLGQQGLLESYSPPIAQNYPAQYRCPRGTWHGFAARARVFVISTRLLKESEYPTSVYDMTDAKWKGRVGIAKPLFGTTATHAASLFALIGSEKAKDFFRALKANDVRILSGNKQVALAAAAGEIAFGLTDTDDALIELENGRPVAVVYPDRGEHQMGTLFIPNTVAVIKGCPHPAEAKRLIDYLLSPHVEAKLARSASAQIPLNPAVDKPTRVETPATIKAMPVDFTQAAAQWEETARFIREEFTGG